MPQTASSSCGGSRTPRPATRSWCASTRCCTTTSHELGVDPGLVKDGVEADLQRLLAEQVDVIGDGLTLVRREFPTAIGPVDLLLRDPAGRHDRRRGQAPRRHRRRRAAHPLSRAARARSAPRAGHGRLRRAGDQAAGPRAGRRPRHPLRDARLRRHEGRRLRRPPPVLTSRRARRDPHHRLIGMPSIDRRGPASCGMSTARSWTRPTASCAGSRSPSSTSARRRRPAPSSCTGSARRCSSRSRSPAG